MVLTCVSCYYPVKNKHKEDNYKKWFEKTLKINCPYVFFTDKENMEEIKKYRGDLPTYIIVYDINKFYSYRFKENMEIHRLHCPSRELNIIWNEKIFMMKIAQEINPYQSEWFQWVDAGICIYRNHLPPAEDLTKSSLLKVLPKDKFIYSSSNKINEKCILDENYFHCVSGTSYLIHKDFMNDYVDLYYDYLKKKITKKNIWTDQLIHTHILKDFPHLFFQIADGYGNVTSKLYN